MDWFIKIKSYYEKGLWSKDQVRNAVDKNKITQEQYNEIIGVEEVV